MILQSLTAISTLGRRQDQECHMIISVGFSLSYPDKTLYMVSMLTLAILSQGVAFILLDFIGHEWPQILKNSAAHMIVPIMELGQKVEKHLIVLSIKIFVSVGFCQYSSCSSQAWPIQKIEK